MRPKRNILYDVLWFSIVVVMLLLALFAPDVPLEGASVGPAFTMKPQGSEAREFMEHAEMGFTKCADGGIQVGDRKYIPNFHFQSKTLTFYFVRGSCK